MLFSKMDSINTPANAQHNNIPAQIWSEMAAPLVSEAGML